MFIMLCVILIISPCYAVRDINEFVKETHCRERGTFTIYNKNSFKFVESERGTNIALGCRYCNDENDKETKLWLQQHHRPNEILHEVELGMKSPLTKNRLFTTPDHTLFIQNVTQEDAGIYICQGYETKGTDFQYIFDVVKKNVPVIFGNTSEWEEYNNETINAINTKLLKEQAFTNITDGLGIKMKVVSEWESWSHCDGCQSLRQRTAKCRVKLRINKNVTTVEKTTTTIKKLPLNAYEMSCHSLDLAQWLPYFSAFVNNVSNYAEIQECMGPCKNKDTGPKKPIYANVFELKEGGYLTLICPESTLESTVKWKKDGNKLKKGTDEANKNYQGHIYIDNFNVLHLSRVTKDQEGAYKCYIDDIFIQQVDIRINIVTLFDTQGLGGTNYRGWSYIDDLVGHVYIRPLSDSLLCCVASCHVHTTADMLLIIVDIKENSIYIISVFFFPFMVYFAGVVVICNRRREYYKLKF